MRRIDGVRLVQLRGKRTQTDLASALRKQGFGTTQTTVSRWEDGQQPRRSVLPALAAELGVSVDELFTDDDEEPSQVPLTLSELELLETLTSRLRATLDRAANNKPSKSRKAVA